MNKVVIVIFLTDSNHTWMVERATEIVSVARSLISEFIQTLHPPHIAYTNFKYLERKFNEKDGLERQTEFSLLKYYLKLEVDFITVKG